MLIRVRKEDVNGYLSEASQNREAERTAQIFKGLRLDCAFVGDDAQRLCRQDKLQGEACQVDEFTLIRVKDFLFINTALEHVIVRGDD